MIGITFIVWLFDISITNLLYIYIYINLVFSRITEKMEYLKTAFYFLIFLNVRLGFFDSLKVEYYMKCSMSFTCSVHGNHHRYSSIFGFRFSWHPSLLFIFITNEAAIKAKRFWNILFHKFALVAASFQTIFFSKLWSWWSDSNVLAVDFVHITLFIDRSGHGLSFPAVWWWILHCLTLINW